MYKSIIDFNKAQKNHTNHTKTLNLLTTTLILIFDIYHNHIFWHIDKS